LVGADAFKFSIKATYSSLVEDTVWKVDVTFQGLVDTYTLGESEGIRSMGKRDIIIWDKIPDGRRTPQHRKRKETHRIDRVSANTRKYHRNGGKRRVHTIDNPVPLPCAVLPYRTVRKIFATRWVWGVGDRDLSGLFLFLLDMAHAPRVVNEAFDPRTVGQLQLDQLA
jgi:hypothetical protein